jgi:hypothetical protein
MRAANSFARVRDPALFAVALALALPSCSGSELPEASASAGSRIPAAEAAPAAAADPGVGSLAERFLEATRRSLGTPYVNGPLGEGEGIDPDPRVDFGKADCVTYLEQALALALAAPDTGAAFLGALDAIRYRDGRVGFVERNHYMVSDWIPANAWLLEDVTVEVGRGATVPVKRTIDRAAFLREHGAEPRPGLDDPREIEIRVVPAAALGNVASRIRSGDLVFWVGKREGIFVVHTGLAVRGEGGALTFRHASSKAGRALDEPLSAYAEAASFAAGFLVLRIREGARAAPASTADGGSG